MEPEVSKNAIKKYLKRIAPQLHDLYGTVAYCENELGKPCDIFTTKYYLNRIDVLKNQIKVLESKWKHIKDHIDQKNSKIKIEGN